MQNVERNKIGILGAGKFGTAIAQVLTTQVLIWGRDEHVIDSINLRGKNEKYFKDIELRDGIEATGDLNGIAKECKVIFICLPSSQIRTVCKDLKQFRGAMIICSKGVEEKTGKLIPTIIEEISNEYQSGWDIGVLAGPNFAVDLVNNCPSIATLAMHNQESIEEINKLFLNSSLKLEPSSDIMGISALSVFKNVIALILGIADASEISLSSRAYIMTVLFQEMIDFAKSNTSVYCESAQTAAGIGDLWLTTSGTGSRNYKKGRSLILGEEEEILSEGFLSIQLIKTTLCEKVKNIIKLLEGCSSLKERQELFKGIFEELHLNKNSRY